MVLGSGYQDIGRPVLLYATLGSIAAVQQDMLAQSA